ncbi:hypothetical protein MalM25_14740 [Planctomycetes bacterium MalM25]|nr:hypothetical protein MalM25_14740 [Planctomycetes bacterium MalM25]
MNRTHRDSLSHPAGPLCARLAATVAALLALAAPSSASMIFDDGGVHNVTTEIAGNALVRDHPTDGWTEVYVGPTGSITGDALVEDLSELHLNGGSVGRDVLAADLAWVFVNNGASVGRFLRTADFSRAWINGGEVLGTLGAQGDSWVEVRGGTFGDALVATDEGVLVIYGANFAIDGNPVPPGPIAAGGQLTGTLRYNVPIDNEVEATGNGLVILVQTPIIPEPATALLLITIASCGLAMRR